MCARSAAMYTRGDSLPEDYKCPLCGAGAEYFKQES